MAELFHVFTRPVIRDGTTYRVEVHGRPQTENLWEGWIEFTRLPEGDTIRSPRETTQPTREALAYWSSGLSPVYLEGALERALTAHAAAEVATGGRSTRSEDAAPFGTTVERLNGHGIIRHRGVDIGEADYDLIVTPPQLRGIGITFESGRPGDEPKTVPDITGRLMGPFYQAQPYAEDVHTLVLDDGRELDFRVLQPDTNEIVGVSWFRPSPA